MKNIKEDMELKKKTKVQNSGAGSLTTTIPSFVRDVLSLEKGDTIEWIINTKTEEIKIRKVTEDK
jgi:bifunctional DNA-binding transcriptional regulator/antitoxin component of YhaV-PrlF toxin-antitoxin module